MPAKPSPAERRRAELLSQITQIGPTLPGSLNTVMNRCGKARCACHADPPHIHGPYITWTRKVAGKTQTRRLTPEQDDRYRPWFENTPATRTDRRTRSTHAQTRPRRRGVGGEIANEKRGKGDEIPGYGGNLPFWTR
jgi:hypothetical protein